MRLQSIAVTSLDTFDSVIPADLITGSALDTFILNNSMQFFGLSPDGARRTRFQAGSASDTFLDDGMRNQFLAYSRGAAFISNMSYILLAEIPDRGKNRIGSAAAKLT